MFSENRSFSMENNSNDSQYSNSSRSNFRVPSKKPQAMSARQLERWTTGGADADVAAHLANLENLANQPDWSLILKRKVLHSIITTAKNSNMPTGAIAFVYLVLLKSSLFPGSTIRGDSSFLTGFNDFLIFVGDSGGCKTRTMETIRSAYTYAQTLGIRLNLFDGRETDLDIHEFLDTHKGFNIGHMDEGVNTINAAATTNRQGYRRLRIQLNLLTDNFSLQMPESIIQAAIEETFSLLCSSQPGPMLGFMAKEKVILDGLGNRVQTITLPECVEPDEKILKLPPSFKCAMVSNSIFVAALQNNILNGAIHMQLDKEGSEFFTKYKEQITQAKEYKFNIEMMQHLKLVGGTEKLFEECLPFLEKIESKRLLQHLLQLAGLVCLVNETFEAVLKHHSLRKHPVRPLVVNAKYIYMGMNLLLVMVKHRMSYVKILHSKQQTGSFKIESLQDDFDEGFYTGKSIQKVINTVVRTPGAFVGVTCLVHALRHANPSIGELEIQNVLFTVSRKASDAGFLGSAGNVSKVTEVEGFYKSIPFMADDSAVNQTGLTMEEYSEIYFTPVYETPATYKKKQNWTEFYADKISRHPDFDATNNTAWMNALHNIKECHGFGMESWSKSYSIARSNDTTTIADRVLKEMKSSRPSECSEDEKLLRLETDLDLLMAISNDIPDYEQSIREGNEDFIKKNIKDRRTLEKQKQKMIGLAGNMQSLKDEFREKQQEVKQKIARQKSICEMNNSTDIGFIPSRNSQLTQPQHQSTPVMPVFRQDGNSLDIAQSFVEAMLNPQFSTNVNSTGTMDNDENSSPKTNNGPNIHQRIGPFGNSDLFQTSSPTQKRQRKKSKPNAEKTVIHDSPVNKNVGRKRRHDDSDDPEAPLRPMTKIFLNTTPEKRSRPSGSKTHRETTKSTELLSGQKNAHRGHINTNPVSPGPSTSANYRIPFLSRDKSIHRSTDNPHTSLSPGPSTIGNILNAAKTVNTRPLFSRHKNAVRSQDNSNALLSPGPSTSAINRNASRPSGNNDKTLDLDSSDDGILFSPAASDQRNKKSQTPTDDKAKKPEKQRSFHYLRWRQTRPRRIVTTSSSNNSSGSQKTVVNTPPAQKRKKPFNKQKPSSSNNSSGSQKTVVNTPPAQKRKKPFDKQKHHYHGGPSTMSMAGQKLKH